ncbi:MAG: hypothetical protein ACE14L_16320 [Terriglobales bacterium]
MVELAEVLKQKEEMLKQREKEIEQLRAEVEVLRQAQRICMGSPAMVPEAARPPLTPPEPIAGGVPKPQIAGRRFP